MPLFQEVPLPGLLPQAPLQRLVRRLPGTPPPGGRCLLPLGPAQSPGPEALGPRAAGGWVGDLVASVALLPAWLTGSLTHSPAVCFSFSVPFSFCSLPDPPHPSPCSSAHVLTETPKFSIMPGPALTALQSGCPGILSVALLSGCFIPPLLEPTCCHFMPCQGGGNCSDSRSQRQDSRGAERYGEGDAGTR